MRGFSAQRRRARTPAADLAAIWNLRHDAAGSTDALGAFLHDGERACTPELQAAIDAGDPRAVRAIEAAILDRELGLGTGRLYTDVLELLDRAEALALVLADRLALEVIRTRRRNGQSLAGLCERVIVHDGRGGVRVEPQRGDS